MGTRLAGRHGGSKLTTERWAGTDDMLLGTSHTTARIACEGHP